MKRIFYNDKYFKILDEYSFSFSNSEVTFNDIRIDFTKYQKKEDGELVSYDCTTSEIPFKFQEIKILDIDNELNESLIFTGFIDDISLKDLNSTVEDKELSLTLLSPLKMATKRNVSVIGTLELETAIRRILAPLVEDGFIIKEMNGISGQITVNFLLETIEYCMNSICNRRNIFWYINEKKEIFISSIDYMYGIPAKSVSEDYKMADYGIKKIMPKIQNVDYANIINFKNVRLMYTSNVSQSLYPFVTRNKKIQKGDIVTFNNPIVIDSDTLKALNDAKEYDSDIIYGLKLTLKNGSTYKIYSIYWDSRMVTDGSITYSNDVNAGEIILQRDEFFNNLITGFKFNLDSDAEWTIFEALSYTALRYTTMRFTFTPEIEKMKGIVSESGQIEKMVDLNERWFTLPDLISYARNLMVQNSNTVSGVELEYDKNPNLQIGDMVEINAPNFFLNGRFAVKGIRYTYVTENQENWDVELGNAELIDSYIDIFRPPEKQNSNTSYDSVIISEFIEESVNESHTIEFADG